ncbi:MAG: FtsX-like permease family protein [Bacteroidales bacterium]|nr:FtsX-like permease family protein [Bacteroidales bacterium]
MQFPLYIAWRYFRSGKSHHIIHLISRISTVAIAVGTAALIVVLSVFNGFESLISSLFNTFDPDLKIELKEGKTFPDTCLDREAIEAIPGVISYTRVIEENVLLRFENQQYIATMKGVSDDFLRQNPLDSMLITGALRFPGKTSAIAGYGVCYYLGINPNTLPAEVSVYVPRRTAKNLSVLSNTFNSNELKVTGIFSVQQDFDTRYVLVPLALMKELLEYSREITSAEIRTDPAADIKPIQTAIESIVGEKFQIRNRFQQQESLYKVMRAEKLAIFLILTFILLIAAFNMIGSQTMVMLDKQKNSAILHGLGATKETLKKIFISQGIITALVGAVSGLIVGAFVCFLQIHFAIIRFETGTTFIVNAYPVEMQFADFLIVFVTVFLIGLFAAFFPVYRIKEPYFELNSQQRNY